METVRERLIQATFVEVYERGYSGASLAHILKTAEAKKGSMYHYFASKKEMVLAMIEEKVRLRMQQTWQELEQQESALVAFLVQSLYDTTNRDFTKGCPLGNLLQECSCADAEFSKLLNDIFLQWQGILEVALQKAINNQEIREIDVSKVAMFIIASIEGALLMAKQSGSEKEFMICIEQLEYYIKSFLK